MFPIRTDDGAIMRILNSFKKMPYLRAITTLLLIVIAAGCTLSGIDKTTNNEITDADLQAASQILGESLSDQNDGIMSSLNDAVTTISQNGFVRTTAKNVSGSTMQGEDSNSGRGSETNITYNYDPETGTHTLTFNRNINHTDFTKSVSDTLKYIFTDINGDFISAPRQQRDRIETIDFKGNREGTIATPNKNSMFSRVDTFLIDGVSNATATLSIDGVHHGEGQMEIQKDNGDQLSRKYQVDINFLNIQIDKGAVQTNNSLEQGVTGTLSWEMVINKTNNGNSQVKTIRGTVEMNGDGSALLRFRDFEKLFRIRLNDGNVSDQDNEFEGIVESVNIERHTLQLNSGRTIRLTENTAIDPDGDLITLKQVAAVMEDGYHVKAKGKGRVNGEVFVASKIKFVTDADREGEMDQIDFEAIVHNAFPDKGLVILQDERRILLTDTTEIDDSGDYQSLAGVKEALELGYRVIIDGRGIKTDREGIDLIATSVRFKKKEESNDATVVAFENTISSVNVDKSTLTLDNGTIILINDATDIDDSGDYQSLGGVKETMGNDQSVRALGKGLESDQDGIDLVAKIIRFEKN
jgi:hypothetical protein